MLRPVVGPLIHWTKKVMAEHPRRPSRRRGADPFRDLHTTLLHQLGLEQDELNGLHLGRKDCLTQIHGKVIEQIV